MENWVIGETRRSITVTTQNWYTWRSNAPQNKDLSHISMVATHSTQYSESALDLVRVNCFSVI